MFGGFGSWGGNKKEETLGAIAMKNSPETEAAAKTVKDPALAQSQSIHGFDPTALERAAKAARELDKSANSKGALTAIMAQEATKQKEQETERAKYQVMQQELAIRRVHEEEQSAARTLEKQKMLDKQRADYQDELERKRLVDQINAQRHLQEEERKKTEESLQRQELIRRKTLEHEAELRRQTEMARIKAETEGRIVQERTNHDLILEKKRLEAKEYRETVLEGIKLAGSTIGAGIQEFVTDRQKLINVAGTLTVLAFGVYTARTSTTVIGRFIESRLGKPSLVRETTRTNFLQMMRSPYATVKQMIAFQNSESALKNIVLEYSLEDRLNRIAVSTKNTKKNRAPYRHLLLHGPPGTGKTMFAKGLARQSGMHYAIMTGGDVAPLGKDAVTEIHKLFDWANSTNKGVIIFVDEADAFLRKRSTEKISEDMRNALNAFLYRTGEASHKFMVVYASNQPEQFDWAINDRIDEMVEFILPSYDERKRMISQYMHMYLIDTPMAAKKIVVKDVDETIVNEFASATEGYSGREISKLAIAWQAAAYGTENATVDVVLLRSVLQETLLSKKQKLSWLNPTDASKMVTDYIFNPVKEQKAKETEFRLKNEPEQPQQPPASPSNEQKKSPPAPKGKK
jgi:ATPase family AAA domain-containing protein 3A/B